MKKLICKDTSPHLIAYIVIFNNMLFAMSMDIHLPAMPLMVEELGASEFQVQLIIIVFAIGAIFSRLFWGPMSDSHGRRKILMATFSIQIIGQTGCCLAPTIEDLVMWRVFQSLGAGISSVIGTAIIADLFRGSNRARVLGLLEVSFPVGFILAPVIGALLMSWTGSWRINFYFILFLKVLTAWLSYRYIPETHDDPLVIRFKAMFIKYFMFLKNKLFILYSFMVGMIIGNYMIFMVNAPFVYITDMGISPTHYAFYQLLPMVFNIIFVLIFRRVVLHINIDTCLHIGIILMLLEAPIFILAGVYEPYLTPEIVLALICYQSSVVPFLIPIFTSKAIDVFPASRGGSSSVIGSVRSICMSVGMLFGGYILGSSVGLIMIAMGALTCLTALTYLYILKLA